jgi:hypothetical protein
MSNVGAGQTTICAESIGARPASTKSVHRIGRAKWTTEAMSMAKVRSDETSTAGHQEPACQRGSVMCNEFESAFLKSSSRSLSSRVSSKQKCSPGLLKQGRPSVMRASGRRGHGRLRVRTS